MFAILGDIEFAVLGSPERMESRRAYSYAEHPVVEGVPRLQWIHDGLETITLELLLHASFTDPSAQLAALRAAGNDHQARPLVFGSGEHRGYFVVTTLSEHSRQLDASGNPIAILVRAELKEWAIASEISASATPVPLATPIAITPLAPDAAGPTSGQQSPVSAIAGVSAVLATPAPSGPSSPIIQAGDVTLGQILRSPN
jgi:phage protein U